MLLPPLVVVSKDERAHIEPDVLDLCRCHVPLSLIQKCMGLIILIGQRLMKLPGKKIISCG